MPDDNYEYPYGDAQTHEALADLDRRLKALEPKPEEAPVEKSYFDAPVIKSEAPVEHSTTDFDAVE